MSVSLRPIQALRLWQQVNLSEVRGKSPDLTMRQAAREEGAQALAVG